ncbi:hypothetical protein M0G74_04630 [Microbulbifer sp. CAU 1566]|uniref:hypothetical protein n=1 Tax=Microbulbifer sp. CAU 1566 TaxID=2933269 RepID=UPI0020033E31|nr:hypothetical protein [Microbulbifer sp. CAU 1566]MCK7596556.1 hypothetical protein [Microbulbifer sp. CAU 1566]
MKTPMAQRLGAPVLPAWPGILALLLLALLGPGTALGFSEANHKNLSRESVQYFQYRCDPKQRTWWADPIIVARGSVGEDTYLRPSRLLNWHFYNPDTRLKRQKLGLANPTPGLYLKNAKEKIKRAIHARNPEMLSDGLGDFSHYIQDMANPSHIAPHFHGGSKKDQFDIYPLPIEPALTLELCNAVEAKYLELYQGNYPAVDVDDLDRLIEKTARSTLLQIQKTYSAHINGKKAVRPWTDFWLKSKNGEFREYTESVLGNRFGKPRISANTHALNDKCLCQLDYPCLFEIQAKDYEEFAITQSNLAMTNTLVALRLLSDIYNQQVEMR